MFAILVVWLDGSQEYLKEGTKASNRTATFASAVEAQYWKDFLLQDISDEIQSCSVVRCEE